MTFFAHSLYRSPHNLVYTCKAIYPISTQFHSISTAENSNNEILAIQVPAFVVCSVLLCVRTPYFQFFNRRTKTIEWVFHENLHICIIYLYDSKQKRVQVYKTVMLYRYICPTYRSHFIPLNVCYATQMISK